MDKVNHREDAFADRRSRRAESGEGFPVVLLHGIPTGPALWRKVIPHLKQARVLAWELNGYGASTGSAPQTSLPLMSQADHLHSWLLARGIRRVVFAGHDLGGGIAQIMAVRYPQACAGLLLTNCVTRDNWPIPEAKLLRSIAPLARRLPQAVVKQMFRVLMFRAHDTPGLAREGMKVHWPPYAHAPQGSARALMLQICSLDARETLAVADALKNVRVPARIVWGAADPWLSVRWGEQLARDLDAPLQILPRARHFTPEDHPETIAEAINALVAQVTEAD